MLICAGTFLGGSGTLAGTPAGELDREGWRSPCPTALAGITHGWTSGGAENDSVVYSSCLLLSQRHSQLHDPLLSGGRRGPHQNLGLLYGPSSYQRWWNLWRTLFLRGVPMAHTPGNGLGPTRRESCSFCSLCSHHTHGRKYFLDVYPCQPWPECTAKQVSPLSVHSEWMACLCKKGLKLDLSILPVLQVMCLCDHLVTSVSSQWSKGVLLGVSGSTQKGGGDLWRRFPAVETRGLSMGFRHASWTGRRARCISSIPLGVKGQRPTYLASINAGLLQASVEVGRRQSPQQLPS